MGTADQNHINQPECRTADKEIWEELSAQTPLEIMTINLKAHQYKFRHKEADNKPKQTLEG